MLSIVFNVAMYTMQNFDCIINTYIAIQNGLMTDKLLRVLN